MGAILRSTGWVGAALICAAAGAAWAQSDETVARLEAPAIMRGAGTFSQRSATPAGAPVLLFHYFDVGPDCRATEVTFRVTSPPAHGTVTFAASQNRPFEAGRPLFGDGDPRARCEDRLVPTRDAVYTPQAGFSGEDSFVIEASEGGTVAQDTVDVSVLSFGKPLRTRYPG
jgi:hypothetical protein